MTAWTGDGCDPPPDKEVDVDHGQEPLSEAQQRRVLELFGAELRAAVARRADGDPDRAALAAYLESRRALLEQGALGQGAEKRSAKRSTDRPAISS
ncbi:hypothetical protein GCM10009839_75100 [Catenulispora yoronensis]|uniref:Uncharacterized protein n=1 Tax=Catenulispora yoronensis TaxID=450799 RepID=A0ABN2V8R0_9ACTN